MELCSAWLCIYATVWTFLGALIVSIRKHYIIFLYELENTMDFEKKEKVSILLVTCPNQHGWIFFGSKDKRITITFCFKFLGLNYNGKTFHDLIHHSSHIKQGIFSICLILSFKKKTSIVRTKKIQADCTNWFPRSKWLHSTASCKVKNQEKKNTKTMCLSYKSWFMEATFQVSCCSATFQAYQENPAAVLPDDFFAGSTHPDVCLWLWWNIGTSEEHCSRKCCWVDTAVKKPAGEQMEWKSWKC